MLLAGVVEAVGGVAVVAVNGAVVSLAVVEVAGGGVVLRYWLELK